MERRAIKTAPTNNSNPAREIAHRSEDSLLGGIVLACSLLLAGFFTFGVPYLMDVFSPNDWGAVLVYFGFGIIGAALHLSGLAVFLIPSHWKATLFACMAVVLVATINAYGSLLQTDFMRPDWPELAYGVPWLCLCLQMPFWFLRIGFHWHVAKYRWNEDKFRLSISSIMGATAAIALVVATGRIACQFQDMREWQELVPFLIATPVIGIVGWLICVTFIRLLLGQVERYSRWTLWTITTVAIITTTTTVCMLLNRWLRLDPWSLVGIATIELGFATLLIPAGYCLRYVGFTLMRRQSTP